MSNSAPWDADITYFASPPWSQVKQFLMKMRAQRVKRILLVCPYNSRDTVFGMVKASLIAHPVTLPLDRDLFLPRLSQVPFSNRRKPFYQQSKPIPDEWGPPDWGPVGGFLVSGNFRLVQEFQESNAVIHFDQLPSQHVQNLVPPAITAFLETNSVYAMQQEAPKKPHKRFSNLMEAITTPWKEVMDDIVDHCNTDVQSALDVDRSHPVNPAPAPRTVSFWCIGSLDGAEHPFIMDTGASTTVASYRARELLNVTADLIPCNEPLIGIGGHAEANEMMICDVALYGYQNKHLRFRARFILVHHPQPLLLLGVDVQQALRMVICLQSPPLPSFCQSCCDPSVIVPCSTTPNLVLRGGSDSKRKDTTKKALVIAYSSYAETDGSTRILHIEKPDESEMVDIRVKLKQSKLTLSKKQLDLLFSRAQIDPFAPEEPPEAFVKEFLKDAQVNLEMPAIVVKTALLIIFSFHKAFSYPGNALGDFRLLPFHVELVKELPARMMPRHFNPRQIEAARVEFAKLEALGRYVEVKNATYASEVVVVFYPGTNKDPRICGDYTLLNACSRDTPYPFTPMHLVVRWLQSSPFAVASGGDQNKAFYQCVCTEDTSKLLAIRMPGSGRVIAPTHMPMGPKNAPAHLEKCTDLSLNGLVWKIMVKYADDQNVPQATAFEHLDAMIMWLSRLVAYHWTLKLAKCFFLVQAMKCLGFIFDESGRRPDPAKVAAVSTLLPPKNVTELWMFWGLVHFYRDLIPELETEYSLIPRIIIEAVKLYHATRKKRPTPKVNEGQKGRLVDRDATAEDFREAAGGERRPVNVPDEESLGPALRAREKDRNMRKFLERVEVAHTPEFLETFEKLKQTLCGDRVVATAQNPHEFLMTLHFDTSYIGTNTTIMQTQPDMTVKVLAYFSKSCGDAEQKLWATELEAWGLVTGLESAEKAGFLYGDFAFSVVVDHQALLWIRNYKGQNRKYSRWADKILDYAERATVVHRPGHMHSVPDALSRLPRGEEALWTMHSFLTMADDPHFSVTQRVDYRGQSAATIWTVLEERGIGVGEVPSQSPTLVELLQTETQKTTFAPALEYLDALKQHKGDVREFSEILRRRASEWQLIDGILYYDVGGWKVFIPTEVVEIYVLTDSHDRGGHFSAVQMFSAMSRVYWFPRMLRKIKQWAKSCQICQEHARAPPATVATHKQGVIAGRWSEIAIDFGGPMCRCHPDRGICVVACRFSSRAHLYRSRINPAAAEFTEEILVQRYYPLHGLPERITTDRGSAFDSVMTATFLKLVGVDHHLTTAYHPQANTHAEMTVKLGVAILTRIAEEAYGGEDCALTWERALPMVEFALNSNIRASNHPIGLSRFEQDLGYQPRGAGTLIPPLDGWSIRSAEAETLAERLQNIQAQCSSLYAEYQEYYRQTHDSRRMPPIFSVGDFVMLSTKNLRSFQKKLSAKWVGPFMVEEAGKFDTYKLTLTKNFSRLHPWFHVSLLKLHILPAPGQSTRGKPPPDHIDEDGFEQYEVERIIAHRRHGKQLMYRVRWFGYPPSEDTWEPAAHLEDTAPDILRDYKERVGTLFHASVYTLGIPVGVKMT